MKKLAVFAILFVAGLALSGPIHSWATGEYITAADLNANMTHLHNNLGHGHGPVIVNADVSTNAAIAHSKLATPGLVPKAWAVMTVACTSGTCALADSQVVSSITWTATGTYNVNFPARGTGNYMAIVSSHVNNAVCAVTVRATTYSTVYCINPLIGADAGTGAPLDTGLNFLLMDTE